MFVIKQRPSSATYLIVLLLVLVVAGLLYRDKPAGAAPAGPDEAWSEFQHLSTSSASGAYGPVIQAAPNGNLLVLYNHEQLTSEGDYTPYFRRSNDGGQSWTTPTAVYGGGDSAAHVDFAFDSSGTAHAVWRTDAGLWYAAEDDWPAPTGMQIASSSEGRIDSPAIAVDPADGTIFVAWLQAGANHVQDVYYRYLREGSGGWQPTPAVALTTVNDGSRSAAPDVAFDADGNIHLVWQERWFDGNVGDFRYEIFYLKGTRSAAGIYQWGTGDPEILSDSNPDDENVDTSIASYQPALASDGNILHVIFEERENLTGGTDEANSQIFPKHVRYQPGNGWPAPEKVAGESQAFYVNTRLPFYLGTSLAVCDGKAHLYFHGSESQNSEELIWGLRYSNGNWSFPQAVTTPVSRHIGPSVACNGSDVFLSFERILSSVTNHQVYYTDNAAGIFLPILFKR